MEVAKTQRTMAIPSSHEDTAYIGLQTRLRHGDAHLIAVLGLALEFGLLFALYLHMPDRILVCLFDQSSSQFGFGPGGLGPPACLATMI